MQSGRFLIYLIASSEQVIMTLDGVVKRQLLDLGK